MEDKSKSQKSKQNRIKLEIKRLEELFKDIPQSTLEKVQSLIQNAAFMTIQLDELQKAINEKGVIEEYQNGANQKGYKKSVEVEIYNTMVKNQISIFKQLSELMPMKTQGIPQEDDDLVKLLKRKKVM